jgi:antitoxin component YwqK of YwqJK toxin-antitoxin module
MSLRVEYDDLEIVGIDAGGGEIMNYQGILFSGIIEEKLNGVLVSEEEFTNGHRGGVQKLYYYPSGQIKQEYTIQFNKMEGVFTEWDVNGNITSQTNWQNGVQVS